MNKTATATKKPATTPASKKAKRAQPAAPAKKAKPASTGKTAPTLKQPKAVGTGLQKRTQKNPAGTQPVRSGLAKEPSSVPVVGQKELPRHGFRRASSTLTLTLTHEDGQDGPQARQEAADWATQPGQAMNPAEPAPRALKETERRFAFEYVQDGNATRAYTRATGTTHLGTAGTMGSRWLDRVEIRAQIEVERAALQKRAGVSVEMLVRRLWATVQADPRELVEYVIESCRYCHGLEHDYQRTQIEYDRDLREFNDFGRQRIGGMYAGKRSKAGREAAARSKDEEVFEVQGGTGFDPHRPPHESCPHCHGHGQGRTLLKDTRTLGYEASLLFDGVKETKDGLEVKMVDRMAALEKLMRHLGAYDADNRQKKPDDGLAELLRRVSGPRAALPINPDPQD